MRSSVWVFALCGLLMFAAGARGQTDNPPFFSSASVGYEAQVSTGFTGVVENAHVAVSNDLKYATVGGAFTNSGPPVLTPFQITTPAGNGTVGASGAATPSAAAPSGAALGRPGGATGGQNILDKPGITLVAQLGS